MKDLCLKSNIANFRLLSLLILFIIPALPSKTTAGPVNCLKDPSLAAARIEQVEPRDTRPFADGIPVSIGQCLSPGTRLLLSSQMRRVVLSEPGDRLVTLDRTSSGYIAPPLPTWNDKVNKTISRFFNPPSVATANATRNGGDGVIGFLRTATRNQKVVNSVEIPIVIPSHVPGRCRWNSGAWTKSKPDNGLSTFLCVLPPQAGHLEFETRQGILTTWEVVLEQDLPRPPDWTNHMLPSDPASRLAWGIWLTNESSTEWSLQSTALVHSGRGSSIIGNIAWHELRCFGSGIDEGC